MTIIPTLTTERLMLVPPALGDLPGMEAFLGSQGARYMGGPYDKIGAWRVFCQDIALWQIFGHGALMIRLRSGSTCVGQVGINHGPFYPEKELGWLLYEGFEGHGYAFEAAIALRQWAFENLRLEQLVSYIDPQNARSIALAERLGAVLDPDALRHDPDDLVYRHSCGA